MKEGAKKKTEERIRLYRDHSGGYFCIDAVG